MKSVPKQIDGSNSPYVSDQSVVNKKSTGQLGSQCAYLPIMGKSPSVSLMEWNPKTTSTNGVCSRVGVLPVCTTDPHQNGGSVMDMDATSQEKGKITKGGSNGEVRLNRNI